MKSLSFCVRAYSLYLRKHLRRRLFNPSINVELNIMLLKIAFRHLAFQLVTAKNIHCIAY